MTSTYLINKMPSRVLGFKTPFSMFKTYFPTSRLTIYLSLRAFGCSIFVHVHDHNRSQFDPHAKNVFLLAMILVKRGTSVMNQKLGRLLSKWMSPFLNLSYFLKLIFGGETL